MSDAPTAPMAIPTSDELDQAKTQDLHDQLEPAARQEYLKYILSRTPADLQDYMKDLIEADFTPEPPDPNEAMVSNGQSVPLQNPDGSAFPVNNGTILVAGSAVTAVRITPASSMTVVRHGDQVNVIDNADAPAPGTPATATVTSGTLQLVKLGAP